MHDITLGWKTGFEIELLAPQGHSRKTLANAIAARHNGARVVAAFHPQAEISLVEDAPVFENLTLAYDIFSVDNELIARCADDLTLQADLDQNAPPKPGWYRIAGDDPRFLRLIMNNANPSDTLPAILKPAAALFGTKLEHFDNGMVRLSDSHGAPVAMAAPLPGERERPCEIITPPIEKNHHSKLRALLEPAIETGFSLPHEAANHIHFDAAALCAAPIITNLVRVFSRFGGDLKALVGANPACQRLGDWPDALFDLVYQPGFGELSWDQARDHLADVGLTKYCDFNLFNMTYQPPGKHTFEVRILPGSMATNEIIAAAALFEALLRLIISLDAANPQIPENLKELINSAPMPNRLKDHWLSRAQ